MKKTILGILGIFMFLGFSCQDEGNNSLDPVSEIQQIRRTLDLDDIELSYGKLDFQNKMSTEDKLSGLKIISVPILGENYERSVLVATFKEGQIREKSTFVSKLESLDKKIDFGSENVSKQTFEGKYSSFNVFTKQETFVKQFTYSEGITSDQNRRFCLRVSPENLAGTEVCTTDNVGNCVGYKMCMMGTFESIACYASFPVCIAAFTLDCQLELCWDSDTDNDYFY